MNKLEKSKARKREKLTNDFDANSITVEIIYVFNKVDAFGFGDCHLSAFRQSLSPLKHNHPSIKILLMTWETLFYSAKKANTLVFLAIINFIIQRHYLISKSNCFYFSFFIEMNILLKKQIDKKKVTY